MSRITQIFNTLNQANKKAFIPFVTAGDGGMELSLEIMLTYVNNGASIIEIGVPFSEPMADGPVIAASHTRAVNAKVSLHDVFALVRQFREHNTEVGIVLMGYLNPIEIFGYEAFADECANSGVDGILVVDNPPEEATRLKALLDSRDIDFIFLVAPTTTDKRLEFLTDVVSGFVYFVSLKGVTGSGNINTDEVKRNLERIKQYIDLPVCVGFGVKNADTAKEVVKHSEGVVVATSFIEYITQYSGDNSQILSHIDTLAAEISEVL